MNDDNPTNNNPPTESARAQEQLRVSLDAWGNYLDQIMQGVIDKTPDDDGFHRECHEMAGRNCGARTTMESALNRFNHMMIEYSDHFSGVDPVTSIENERPTEYIPPAGPQQAQAITDDHRRNMEIAASERTTLGYQAQNITLAWDRFVDMVTLKLVQANSGLNDPTFKLRAVRALDTAKGVNRLMTELRKRLTELVHECPENFSEDEHNQSFWEPKQ